MKKILALALAVMMVLSLTACGPQTTQTTTVASETTTVATETSAAGTTAVASSTYADGVYFAVEPAFSEKTGWKGTLIVEVKDGKITSADWNAVNVNSGKDKKHSSKDGEYNMVAYGKAQSEWHEQAALVEQYLVDNQGFAGINYVDDQGHTDSISGVSIHVNDFEALFNDALAQGPVGVGPYVDGHYYVKDEAATGEWADTVNFNVINGYIVVVNWSGVNAEGADKKTVSIEGNYGMVAKGKAQAEWHEQAALVEEALINAQDPLQIETAEDGTTDAISGVSIKVKNFLNLVASVLKTR